MTWKDVDSCIARSGDPSAYTLGSTSTVASPTLVADQWYVNALLIPHEGLRFLLLLLERSVQPHYLQPTRPWKVQRLFHFYRSVVLTFVGDHHRSEDGTYFPWIRARATLPIRLNEEHEGLLTRLDGITAMEGQLQSCTTDEAVSRWAVELTEQVEELGLFMRDHLSEEETCVIPALRDHFTKQEHNVVVGQVVAHLPPSGVPMTIAVNSAGQLRAGGEPLLDSFLAELPPEAVQAWRAMWRSQLAAEMAYIDAIRLDQDDEPPFDKSTLFPTQN